MVTERVAGRPSLRRPSELARDRKHLDVAADSGEWNRLRTSPILSCPSARSSGKDAIGWQPQRDAEGWGALRRGR